MDIFLWILLALLVCACGLFFVWVLRGRLVTPVRGGRGARLHAVVAASGSPAHLEQTVKGLLWLIHSGTLGCDILIVDAGLDPEARTMAKLLARDEACIHLCSGNICFTEDTWRKTDT